MPDPVSALQGATYEGFAKVREIGPLGMITLRAKGVKGLDKAVKAAVGTKLPAQRRIEGKDGRACGWMSPDEYLLVLPYAEVPKALAALDKALTGQHYLAVDVSDARAVFRVEGAQAADVLRKLTPADLDRMEPGELRRSRAAQVAAAFWHEGDGYTVVCFRSVADYMMGILSHGAMPGTSLD
jgi:sarcosine oxidase subunit gamma